MKIIFNFVIVISIVLNSTKVLSVDEFGNIANTTIVDNNNELETSSTVDSDYKNRLSEMCSIDENCTSTTTTTTTTITTSAATTARVKNTITPKKITTTTVIDSTLSDDIMKKWKYNLSSSNISEKFPENRTDHDENDNIQINVIDRDSNSIANVNDTNDHSEIGNNTTTDRTSTNGNETKLLLPKKNIKFDLVPTIPCDCDHQKGACDLNCCCDLDCEFVNRDIFDNCTNLLEQSTTDAYCPAKLFNSHMFCVVTDNLYSRHYYQDRSPVQQLTRIKRVLHRNDIYGWSFPDIKENEDAIINEEYKIGSKMWLIFNETQLLPFTVPNSMITTKCRSDRSILYLTNTVTHCDRYSKNPIRESCNEGFRSFYNMERFYKNLSIIAFPHLLNVSDVNCTNNCVPITPFICRNGNGGKKCERIANLTDSKSNGNGNLCRYLVQSVHYQIVHNGTEGIKQANVYFEINDDDNRYSQRQRFRVTFAWFNQTTRYFDKSGRPGYLRKKPIITGNRNNQIIVTDEKIEMSYDPNRWLTVFQPYDDNRCRDEAIRRNVLFGQNVYAHCYLEIPETNESLNCERLQNKIWKIIFGPYVNVSDVYISAFGDPDPENPRKWVPLLSDLPTASSLISNDSCNYRIITSIKIDILYSITGDYNRPQNTVFGATLTGSMSKTKFETTVRRPFIQITTVVNFYDVTHEPIRIFAEPPTYEIRLPPDFFYPFLSSTGYTIVGRNYNYQYYWFSVITCIFGTRVLS